MTKILKGDTSPSVQLVLAEGFDYTGATVEVRYQGAVRTFTGRHAGETIAFSFSAEETAPMVLGAFPVTVRIATANGGFFTVDNGGVKIAVTDDPAEVWVDGVIAVDAHGMLYGITDLPAHYTDKDVVAKIREIMRRGGAMLCALFMCGFAFGASVQTAQKQDIWNDGQIVTNVDFTGLATTAQLNDGHARMLPAYLHHLEFADSYADDAAWYYALADIGGACSSVRDGNAYSRNFDFPYDERAEFVVTMKAGPGRFASVGLANCGTNLTERFVTSGQPSRFYKALPGATVDGINERGVVCNINVVPMNWREHIEWTGHEIDALGGVRWVLDHAPSAGWAASNLAAKVYIPDALKRKGYSAHFMVADERETWIVEDGTARNYTAKTKVLTNFRVFDMETTDDPYGTGYERYDLLASGHSITSAWFRAAYRRPFARPSEFAALEVGTHTNTNALLAWADANIPQGAPESLTRGGGSWQTIHCSVYDISNRTVRVCVQENPDWYVFALPATGGGDGKVKSVNGMDGEVNLSAADIGAVPTTVTNDVKVQLSEKLDILPNGSTNGIRLAVSGSGLKVDADANVSIRVSGSRSMSDYGITNRFVSSVNGNPVGADGNVNVPTVPDDYDEVKAMAEAAQTADDVQSAIANAGHVTADELEPIEENVNNALLYSQAIYRYMVGNGSAWFESTNYNVNAEQAAEKVRYQPEPWEDVRYTPPSLQLFEIRGGVTNRVFDSRDWTVYYWNFKSAQLSNALARATFDLGENVRTNYMRRGWSKYTAVNGLDNPATDTTWIDTPKVSLFAGHQWEKLVEVGGAGYYTITGNGIELAAQDAESTFLTIKDFEGNACLTFRKTSSYLVYCECGTDIVSTYRDSQNRVVFHLTTDVQPTAEFSTILDTDSFIEQGEDGCPANYEWTGSANNWDCHFLLKPGISSDACFARFKVMREGENVVEHTIPIKLNGGIVFEQNGQALKCKPVAQGTSVGSTVNWVIAQ